jgi:hypothetical protein
LCWNLSKTIKTKDLPHIFTTYLPEQARARQVGNELGLPLQDFDASREEVVAEIKRAPTRRADNLVSDLLVHARAVSMQARVSQAMARHFRRVTARTWAVVLLLLLVTAAALWFAWDQVAWPGRSGIGLTGIVLAFAAWLAGRWFYRRQQSAVATPAGLDLFFERAYRRELGLHERTDLRALWETVRGSTLQSFRVLRPHGLPRPAAVRKPLRQLEHVMDAEIPKLRRTIAGHRTPSAPPEDQARAA